jgi:NAD(P)H dehydrogenase (quinone)
MEQKVLVTGATGAQGGAVVKLLASKGVKVRALLTPTDNDSWFKANNVETVIGSFDDRESLNKALEGITNVSLVYPLIYDWDLLRNYTENLIYAFKQHKLQSIVFNTSLPLPPQKTGSLAADIKLEFLEQFQQAGLPVITIMPSFYLDNITAPWALPVIKEHSVISYPLPADAQFAWLSHFNLAQYTYQAILKPALVGKIFPIGGELLSGNQLAEKVSKVIGKSVHYVYQKPHEFKQFLVPMYGEEVAEAIATIYAGIATNTEPFKAFHNKEIFEGVFNVKLQTFDEWAKTIEWK